MDTHLEGPYSYKYLNKGQSYQNTWNISDQAGFSSDLEFTGGEMEFWFSDDYDRDDKWKLKWTSKGYQWYWNDGEKEYVQISVGSISNWFYGDVDGSHDYPYSLDNFDLISGALTGSLLADVAADGMLSYKVKAKKGDTYLKETRLTVHARTANVPDSGSTLALLGLGLVGLAAIKRRR